MLRKFEYAQQFVLLNILHLILKIFKATVLFFAIKILKVNCSLVKAVFCKFEIASYNLQVSLFYSLAFSVPSLAFSVPGQSRDWAEVLSLLQNCFTEAVRIGKWGKGCPLLLIIQKYNTFLQILILDHNISYFHKYHQSRW